MSMSAVAVAPMFMLGIFGGIIPLIFLGLIIYFLVQVKHSLEDLSLEVRDTRQAIEDAWRQPAARPNSHSSTSVEQHE